jgi:Secretion system C-terminal sorting domain
MKQILLFSLFFFTISSAVLAQNVEFAPVGAYWKYSWATAGGSGELLTKVVGDTTVNGMIFKKLYDDEFSYYPIPPLFGVHRYSSGFLSVRNDSVFMGLNQGRFLYSFKMQIGDTIKFSNFSTYERYAVADSVGRMDLNGTNRRVVYCSKYCKDTRNGTIKKSFGRSQIVENHGLLYEGLIWNEPDCGFLDFNLYSLSCYQAGSFRFPTNVICPPTVATNEPIYAHQISISPNPVSNDLSINYPSELQLNNVELINYLGQKISINSSENCQKINVSHAPNGIYFLNLWFDNQRVVKKIMIQH